MGLFLCGAAFLATYLAGRRSLGAGLCALLCVGYSYGLLRARYLDGFSHFMFDMAVLGLYAAIFIQPAAPLIRRQGRMLSAWLWVLVAWPLIMFLFPFQHYLIQLVGLRAAIFYLPFLLLGVQAREADLERISHWVAGLNLAVLVFAMLEYVYGIEIFYPFNPVTELLYRSTMETVGYQYHRIPGTFTNAHSYGGVMCLSLPFLVNRLALPLPRKEKTWLLAGLLAAALGIFLCGSRSPVVILAVAVLLLLLFRGISLKTFVYLLLVGLVTGYVISGSTRMQRFLTLGDTAYVSDRISGSLNSSFLELLYQYPMGAGLGSAAGTSIPYFLAHLQTQAIGLENEFGRLLVEQGFIGLLLWVSFLCWLVMRKPAPISQNWRVGVALMHALIIAFWGTAWIGTGMLTWIPGSAILLFQMGVLAQEPAAVPSANPISKELPQALALAVKV